MKKYNCFSKDNGLLKMIKTHSYLVCIDKLGLYDDMLVIAGDNVPDLSLVSFIEYSKNNSNIMRYYEPDDKKLLKCGVVTFDKNDKFLTWPKSLPHRQLTSILTRMRKLSWN